MRLPVIAALFFLSACGFSPIYGSHGSNAPVAEELSNVAIANIPDRNGQFLRNHLIDRIYFSGRPEKPTTSLKVLLRSTETDLGIQKDATASRRELNLWANYTLTDLVGNELLKGVAHSAVGYSKLDAQYGTLSAKENANERAIHEIGEQIVNRLGLYFAERS